MKGRRQNKTTGMHRHVHTLFTQQMRLQTGSHNSHRGECGHVSDVARAINQMPRR